MGAGGVGNMFPSDTLSKCVHSGLRQLMNYTPAASAIVFLLLGFLCVPPWSLPPPPELLGDGGEQASAKGPRISERTG